MDKHKHKLGPEDYVFDKYNCFLRSTHGLPFACYMYITENNTQGGIYCAHINPISMTLKINEGEDTKDVVQKANAHDKRYFQSLVDEVFKVNSVVI